MATIACFELQKWEKEYFKKQLKQHKLIFIDEPLNPSHIPKIRQAQALSVFIYSPVTAATIKMMPQLKCIATRSTGFDHIDGATARKANIDVCNVPFYGENTVAEHAFALLLALSRKIVPTHTQIRKGDYSTKQLTGFDLKGKTLGLIGSGHIGLHLARMAKGFDMNVITYDIIHNEFMANVIGFTYADLNTVIKNSDVVSIHVPYNKHTHHLIGAKQLHAMKKGSIIINTARGGVIDTDALASALSKEHLGGAGLDVIEDEHLVFNPPKQCTAQQKMIAKRNKAIIEHPNVLFTPHNAFNSIEALYRILDTTIDNLRQWEKGKPTHIVNL